MKAIFAVIMCIMVFGCARSQMNYQLSPGTSHNDFQRAKQECGEDTGGGGFIFGPLIVVAPVIAVVESISFVKRHKFQDCMEAKGFKCVAGCPHESAMNEKTADSQVLAKESEKLSAEKKMAVKNDTFKEKKELEASQLTLPITKDLAKDDFPKQPKQEAVVWLEKSRRSVPSKNWSEVIRTASAAIEIDPFYADAYALRSWAYLEKGFREYALSDVEKALQLDNGNITALNNRGLYYLRGGDSAKARDDFEKVCLGGLEIGCDNFKLITGYKPSEKKEYCLKMADQAFGNKDWDSVIKFTSEIADDQIALSVRAGAYANKGLLSEAIADCDSAIKMNPDLALAYNNKGYALELMGKQKESLLTYEISCNLKMPLGCSNFKRLTASVLKQ